MRKLVVLGTNDDTVGLVPGVDDMLAVMEPAGEEVAMFRDADGAYSPDGAEHWPCFFMKFIVMAWSEPHIAVSELAAIVGPTLVVVGDDDMGSLEHTVALYRAIPGAELAVIPGASHAAMLEKPALFNQLVVDFLEHEPESTMLPLRRARGAQIPG